MDIAQSQNVQSTTANGGFWQSLLAAIRKIFAGSASTETPATSTDRVGIVEDNQEDDANYVTAPGGYRIRVPQADDMTTSIGEMLPTVREALSAIPPLPHVVVELMREIRDPNATSASVARIASSDPSLAASLLRTVNSAAFGFHRKITSATDAITYLGFASVKSMVLRLQLDQMLATRSTDPQVKANVEDLWVHSLAVSYVADCLAQRVPGVDRGFVSTLGLLHDIGKLAIESQFPEKAQLLRNAAKSASPDESPLAREARLLGVDHAGLGANLAAQWKLPADLVQAIRWHHLPAKAFEPGDPKPLQQAMRLVQIANQLTKYCYAHTDDVDIETIPDEAFALLGFQPGIAHLLNDQAVREAIGRAIFFTNDGKTDATNGSRFLRLHFGEETGVLMNSLAPTAQADRIRLVDNGWSVSFPETVKPMDASRSSLQKRSPSDWVAEKSVVLSAPATSDGVKALLQVSQSHRSSLKLGEDFSMRATMTLRCLLTNLAGRNAEETKIELSQSRDDVLCSFAVRSDALAYSNRFGPDTNPAKAAAALEAELASVLNLKWFDEISVSPDGSALKFTRLAA